MIKKDVSPQEFVSFLKNNNCYKQFRKGFYTPYLRDSYHNSSKECFSQKLMRTNYDYRFFLSYAFEWNDTKEGYDFWYSVRHKWENI